MVDRLVRVITFVALLAGWPDSGASAHGCDIIVDPNPLRASTVSSAHNVTPILLSSISREKVGADIHVCFSAGRHHLGGKPWRIVGKDIPPNVHWRAENYKLKSTISSGFPLTNWYACNQDSRCPGWDGVFVHYIKDIVGFDPSAMPLRNLWVDGIRAVRTAIEGESIGLNATASGYAAPAGSLLWTSGELRWPRQIKNWIEPRCSATVSGNEIKVDAACWKDLVARNGGKLPPAPAYIENVDYAAPGPGEFFLQMITYFTVRALLFRGRIHQRRHL